MIKTVNEAPRRQSREYSGYLQRKIAVTPKDKAEGRSLSNEAVETEFSAVRNRQAR